MNNRKSLRLNKNPAYKAGYAKKHFVVVLNMSLMENAQNWVRNKNNEFADYQDKIAGIKLTPTQIAKLPYYQLMDFRDLQFNDPKKSTSDKLSGIANDTVIYLLCHGYIENTFEPDLAMQINLKNIREIDIEFNAIELFKFLKNHGLAKTHKVIKLAACYSEKFVQEFSTACKACYPDMTVAGYYGELIVNQKNNHKYAGLIHESGYLIEEEPKLYSIIDKSKIEPYPVMIDFYRSHHWHYTYKNGKLIEGPAKKGEADLHGFIPIPIKPVKKRKQPAEEKQVWLSQAVYTHQSSTSTFFSNVESKEIKIETPVKKLKR
jgi:hypothetical protein